MSRTLADMTDTERQQMIGRWFDTRVAEDGDPTTLVLLGFSGYWPDAVFTNPAYLESSNPRWSVQHWNLLTPRLDLPPAWTPEGQPLPGKWQWRDTGFQDEGHRTEDRARRDAAEHGTDVERRFVTEWEES